MDERGTQQLDKILALADSNHEGEAVVAVRKARQMLSRDGLSFGDLARAVSGNTQIKSPGVFSFLTGGREYMASQINHLRQQVEDLQAQLQTQDFQLDFWRRRAVELEQTSLHAASEAERWKTLASETADRLWDLGRSLGREEFISSEPAPESIPKAASPKTASKKR